MHFTGGVTLGLPAFYRFRKRPTAAFDQSAGIHRFYHPASLPIGARVTARRLRGRWCGGGSWCAALQFCTHHSSPPLPSVTRQPSGPGGRPSGPSGRSLSRAAPGRPALWCRPPPALLCRARDPSGPVTGTGASTGESAPAGASSSGGAGECEPRQAASQLQITDV